MSKDRKPGRPSLKTPAKLDELCARLAEGVSLREVCRAEDMPSLATVIRWLSEDEAFQVQYARAKELSAEAMTEDMLDISDNASNDWMMRNDPDNEGWVANHDHIARAKLRIETRKWLAGKMKPKKYGDKVHTEISDPDGNNPFAAMMALVGGNGRPGPKAGD
jgi:F420-dependent methylenetetrahydromethanopterin dehydrogenase